MEVYTCDLDGEINLDHLDKTYFIFCLCPRLYQNIGELSLHVDSADELPECIPWTPGTQTG